MPTTSGQAALAELVHSELIDQVMFTPRAEYAFRHPLVQTVAYESQLKTARAQLHRRLAAALDDRNASAADEIAAVIAGHLEAAGDLREAFGWHMRAGNWFTNRDINAARKSWRRRTELADQLPAEESDRRWMRIAPRALLCGSTWRAGGSIADTGFRRAARPVHPTPRIRSRWRWAWPDCCPSWRFAPAFGEAYSSHRNTSSSSIRSASRTSRSGCSIPAIHVK